LRDRSPVVRRAEEGDPVAYIEGRDAVDLKQTTANEDGFAVAIGADEAVAATVAGP
jgi:hypothetical protein